MPRLLSSSYLHPACGCRFSRLGLWWWLTMLSPGHFFRAFHVIVIDALVIFHNVPKPIALSRHFLGCFTSHSWQYSGWFIRRITTSPEITEFLISLQPHRCPSAKHAWLCMWNCGIQRDQTSESVFCGKNCDGRGIFIITMAAKMTYRHRYLCHDSVSENCSWPPPPLSPLPSATAPSSISHQHHH